MQKVFSMLYRFAVKTDLAKCSERLIRHARFQLFAGDFVPHQGNDVIDFDAIFAWNKPYNGMAVYG